MCAPVATAALGLQDVCVVETKAFGTVLVLDGVIQCTDRDEFSYQEKITHLPVCSLPVGPAVRRRPGGGAGIMPFALCAAGDL